jgi:hypothetical protein
MKIENRFVNNVIVLIVAFGVSSIGIGGANAQYSEMNLKESNTADRVNKRMQSSNDPIVRCCYTDSNGDGRDDSNCINEKRSDCWGTEQ